MDPAERSLFLCHASEDKEAFVRPLARELNRRGITYWLDEADIKWGDKITQRINDGLARARYIVVFLSANFLGKNWPESELGAALNKENTKGQTVVLPLILGDDVDSVLDRYPLLRDKVYLKWSQPLSMVVDHLAAVIADKSVTLVAQEQAEWNPEPTISELFGESVRTEGFGQLQDILAERPDLWLNRSIMDLPLTKVSADLPTGMQHFVAQFVDKYRQRNESLRSAIRAEPPSDGNLQIVSIGKTHNAEFDVMLRNLSNNTVYITRINIRVLKDAGMVLPLLGPSAKYEIPMGNLAVGDANGIDVSHVIEPHKADRFLVALQTTRVLYLRLTLEYNRLYSISENAWLWR